MTATPQGKTVRESLTEQVYIVMPQHLNGFGNLFGGQLAMWIDLLAGVVASRHCRTKITTAAIDNLRFHESVGPSSLLVMRGRMTYTGRTSMEVRVDSFVENTMTGERSLVNTAFVTQVALNDDNRPIPVPPLIPETDEERANFMAGKKRREFRQKKYELYE
ncbi:MAG: acyl-CoA thioesterase [Planctomycetaceae bacterium]|nr:acyl-CoA thioesterase [Planctomycetaceae bacterium]